MLCPISAPTKRTAKQGLLRDKTPDDVLMSALCNRSKEYL